MKEGKGVVDSFDFCAPYVSCDVQLRIKVFYGVYMVIQSHALLICQPFVARTHNNLIEYSCLPTNM